MSPCFYHCAVSTAAAWSSSSSSATTTAAVVIIIIIIVVVVVVVAVLLSALTASVACIYLYISACMFWRSLFSSPFVLVIDVLCLLVFLISRRFLCVLFSPSFVRDSSFLYCTPALQSAEDDEKDDSFRILRVLYLSLAFLRHYLRLCLLLPTYRRKRDAKETDQRVWYARNPEQK